MAKKKTSKKSKAKKKPKKSTGKASQKAKDGKKNKSASKAKKNKSKSKSEKKTVKKETEKAKAAASPVKKPKDDLATKKSYALRNDKNQVFHIAAEVTRSGKSGVDGAEIKAVVSHQGIPDFIYVVDFGGEFVETKANFTPGMYLHTAVSLVESQIESKRHQDTRMLVHKHSGLTLTEALT